MAKLYFVLVPNEAGGTENEANKVVYSCSAWREDTDKVVKTKESTHHLFIRLHDDVNPGPNTLIHQLCK